MSHKGKQHLADSAREEHTIEFSGGEAVAVLCPRLGRRKITGWESIDVIEHGKLDPGRPFAWRPSVPSLTRSAPSEDQPPCPRFKTTLGRRKCPDPRPLRGKTLSRRRDDTLFPTIDDLSEIEFGDLDDELIAAQPWAAANGGVSVGHSGSHWRTLPPSLCRSKLNEKQMAAG